MKNSRDRVLAAINHVEPDRVPVDMWALPPVTDNLRAHLGGIGSRSAVGLAGLCRSAARDL
jgi:hypothetical protein